MMFKNLAASQPPPHISCETLDFMPTTRSCPFISYCRLQFVMFPAIFARPKPRLVQMKNRLRKQRLYARVWAFKRARYWMTDEQYAWERISPVGREFGSPDFEHLMTLHVTEGDANVAKANNSSTS